jgi:hypothetical protein
MIDYDALAQSIYDVVQPILNCPTIISKQGKPRPAARTYGVIEIGNVNQLGFSELSEPDVDGIADTWQHSLLSVQFQAFGTGAKNAIQKLQHSFNKDSVVQSFLGIGLAVVDHSDILDIPAIRDTIWEESSRFTATFHVRIEDTDDVGVVETVTIDGSLVGSDSGNPIITETIVTIAP